MKLKKQSGKILQKDWLRYHPYDDANFADNYYHSLCSKVLDIIQNSEIMQLLDNKEDAKEMACIFVAYFEDIISETNLFSAFTKKHTQLYGTPLPFYSKDTEYYEDESIYKTFAF
jgi:hypothetical protein